MHYCIPWFEAPAIWMDLNPTTDTNVTIFHIANKVVTIILRNKAQHNNTNQREFPDDNNDNYLITKSYKNNHSQLTFKE